MGSTGVGKSSFIRLVSGSDVEVGDGLASQTHLLQSVTFTHENRGITLLDTPGFNDTNRSDADVLNVIADHFSESYANGRQFAAVLYFHRISDNRMSGSSLNNMKMCEAICGDDLSNLVICTTMWDQVDQQAGEAREQELCGTEMFFGGMLKRGAKYARLENTRESALRLISQALELCPRPLGIQREMVDNRMALGHTAAGSRVDRRLLELEQKRVAELRKAEEEMKLAAAEQDVELQRELANDRLAYFESLQRIREDRETLARQLEQLKNADLARRRGSYWKLKQLMRRRSKMLEKSQASGPAEQLEQMSTTGALSSYLAK
ncbi:hypothetical protein BOTBODRAFT_568639 [Botryobasidium botryosum FD-172 SS1]|uniref:G domain-containing protein n=1 Tax=Botryobasidium botryosum (strain FD-172 SS1) TaxID=930990 RepID=A0A067M9S3_BOTB1|nr:hypothetical protein BOTBODRAFT_568639 [Botryobasidium botryosum FD-172 SS1]